MIGVLSNIQNASNDFVFRILIEPTPSSESIVVPPEITDPGEIATYIAEEQAKYPLFVVPFQLGGTYDLIIDWGDTTSSPSITAFDTPVDSHKHNYASPGVYTITISGTDLRNFRFSNSDSAKKVREILNWGFLDIENNGLGFLHGCTGMTIQAQDFFNPGPLTSCQNMFHSNYVNPSIPGIATWDVSGVASFQYMFAGNYLFNDNISSWNMASAVNLEGMLKSCYVFNQPVGNWVLPATCTIVVRLFEGCLDFDQPLNSWGPYSLNFINLNWLFYNCQDFNQSLSTWLNAPNPCNSLHYTFRACHSFDQNINSWNISNVTDLSSTFEEAFVFDKPLSNWDTSSVQNMSYTFSYAKKFNQPLNTWDTSAVTNMFGMFRFAHKFNQVLDGDALWDTSLVISMGVMFYNALEFNQDVSDWKTSSVTDMSGMFAASSFNFGPLATVGPKWDVSSVTDMSNMFRQCPFNKALTDWVTSSLINTNYMFLTNASFNQEVFHFNMSSVTSVAGMFYGATSFNKTVNSWDVSLVQVFDDLFRGAINFNREVTDWATGSATSMARMFFGATQFNNEGDIPLVKDSAKWDVSLVENMSGMFYNTKIKLGLYNWNTSSCTNMSSMLYNCTLFNEDISGWDVSFVTDFNYMFQGASIFNQAIGSPGTWDTSAALSMEGMFLYAYGFDQTLENFDVSLVGSGISGQGFTNFLNSVTLSTANYDATLNSFAGQTLISNQNFHGGLSKYTAAGQASRDTLTNPGGLNWTIIDQGLFP